MLHHRAKTEIEFDGKKYSLRSWCTVNNAPYDAALRRWHDGVRDPVELLYGDGAVPKMGRISDDDIEYLKRTRRVREGQEDEWEIACDLIAQPHIRIPEIRKLVMG